MEPPSQVCTFEALMVITIIIDLNVGSIAPEAISADSLGEVEWASILKGLASDWGYRFIARVDEAIEQISQDPTLAG